MHYFTISDNWILASMFLSALLRNMGVKFLYVFKIYIKRHKPSNFSIKYLFRIDSYAHFKACSCHIMIVADMHVCWHVGQCGQF